MDDKESRNDRGQDNDQGARPPMRGFPIWLLVSLLMLFVVYSLLFPGQQASRVTFGYFQKLIEGKQLDGEPYKDGANELGCMIESVQIGPRIATGTFKFLPDAEPTVNLKGELVEPKEGEKLEKHFIVDIESQLSLIHI